MDEEISEEYRKKIQSATCELLNILTSLSDADEALHTLSAATAYILCNGVSSQIEANLAYNTFVNIIGDALKTADETGDTVWHKGLYH